MLGQQEATVAGVRPFDLHGVTYHDVEVVFDDGARATARLGPEAVPEGLREGDRVLVTRAAGMVISLTRP